MINKLIVLIAMVCFTVKASAQNTYKALIKSAETKETIPGVSVRVLQGTLGTASDSEGKVLLMNVPSGRQLIQYSAIGFKTRVDTALFPLATDSTRLVMLETAEQDRELDVVVVSATRSSRTIDNIPTRIEVIAGEELDEKSNMKPGDIRMMLAESTGVQTQQTSATSGNSSIRIQGLDGKYTQIIRDGFPLYAGFSGGLGLLQIAPLDLQQVEVIKGSSSTLYGGGAIAGLVNLVSKKPTAERQLSFLLNGTSAGGLDASGFYARKFDKTGATVYAAYNHGSAFDPSNTGFTAIPKYDRITLNPKLFFYLSTATTFSAGINATAENRIGGDITYIKDGGSAVHSYFEKNKTDRFSTQLELDHKLNDKEKLVLRNSVSYYNRSIGLPDYLFSGSQFSTYAEANYSRNTEKSDWVAGINLLTDNFNEDQHSNSPLRNYHYTTVGAFAQNTWNLTKRFTLESGLRGDYHNEYGFFFLPKLSGLYKVNDHISTRLGGGLGYKAPSVFTEDAERIQFRNVLPIDVNNTRAERSYGANYDINYKTGLFNDRLIFSINQMFFYTRISSPILLGSAGGNTLSYMQPDGHIDTKGMETNAKLTYSNFKLFIGYTLADVYQNKGSSKITYPLVSKHRLNNVLMYELEDEWKVGAEAYYFSKQRLNDGAAGKSYWTAGLMVEKLWERFSIFINFENLTDTRQTKFDTIYTGSISNPVFRDIYAPVDGFVANGGIKIKL
jgi:outer membrane receptor for ferrienterochelin and colicins